MPHAEPLGIDSKEGTKLNYKICIHPSTCQHPLRAIQENLRCLHMYMWGLAQVIVSTSKQLHQPKPDKQLAASGLYNPIVPLTNNEVTVGFYGSGWFVKTRCFFPKLNKGSWQVLLNVSSDHQLPSSPVTPHPASGSWVPESSNVCAWVNIVYTHRATAGLCSTESQLIISQPVVCFHVYLNTV